MTVIQSLLARNPYSTNRLGNGWEKTACVRLELNSIPRLEHSCDTFTKIHSPTTDRGPFKRKNGRAVPASCCMQCICRKTSRVNGMPGVWGRRWREAAAKVGAGLMWEQALRRRRRRPRLVKQSGRWGRGWPGCLLLQQWWSRWGSESGRGWSHSPADDGPPLDLGAAASCCGENWRQSRQGNLGHVP